MTVKLPNSPVQDLVYSGGKIEFPQGCAEWSIALWAFVPVFLILFGACHGVTFVGLKIRDCDALNAGQWTLLVLSLVFFAYVEGLRGFHQAWVPFCVRRALVLPKAVEKDLKSFVVVLLAPFFTIGLFCATPRRLLKSYVLYAGIIGLIVLVKHLDCPYHEIVDLGVAIGISLGTISFIYTFIRAGYTKQLPPDIDAPTKPNPDEYDEINASLI